MVWKSTLTVLILASLTDMLVLSSPNDFLSSLYCPVLIKDVEKWGQVIDPNVLIESSFPPARPSLNNLNAACLYGNGRPRHPAYCFPSAAYAYAQRAGNAVNRLESWLGQCCYGGLALGNEQILCCAKQAWETALSSFCTEEYSTMTLVHECCEKIGEDQWSCFERLAPNPSYHPLCGYIAPPVPPDTAFTWDPKTC